MLIDQWVHRISWRKSKYLPHAKTSSHFPKRKMLIVKYWTVKLRTKFKCLYSIVWLHNKKNIKYSIGKII